MTLASRRYAVPKSDQTYTISELSREFAVTPRALRFYEDKGLLAPRREGLNRVYSARERGRLQLILRGKRLGFPLTEIKGVLDLYDLEGGERMQMQTVAKKFRQRLVVLRAQREDLEHAIEEIERGIAWLDERLDASAPSTASPRPREAAARRRLEGAS
jgi:DNA-binding transcriptional MerR regulator